MLRTFRVFLVGVFVMLVATDALAHTRSESYSEWQIDHGEINYWITIPERDALELLQPAVQPAPMTERLLNFIEDAILVEPIGVGACETGRRAIIAPSRKGFYRVEGSFYCNETDSVSLSLVGLFTNAPRHIHYARASGNERIFEYVFSRNHTQYVINFNTVEEPGDTHLQSIFQLVPFGAMHVLQGWDHLAFLFALLLIAGSLRDVGLLILGFSIGHSLSMALAVLGFVTPNTSLVEAMIGFTILVVVVEAVIDRTGQTDRSDHSSRTAMLTWIPVAIGLAMLVTVTLRSPDLRTSLGVLGAGLAAWCYLRLGPGARAGRAPRILITSVFGVIHGFGFAGGLIEANLSPDQIVWWLLSFNVGVEVGQVAVIGALLLAWRSFHNVLPNGASYTLANANILILGAVGTFWSLSRIVF